MRKFFLVILLLTACKGFSQTHTLDSLKNLIDIDKKDDSVKVKMLFEYGRQLSLATYLTPQPDYGESMHYFRASMQLANKIKRPDLATDSYLWISGIYSTENMMDSSIAVLLEGLGVAERLDLKDKLRLFYYGLGESYRLSNQLTLSEYYDHKYYDIVSIQKNDTLMLAAVDLFISLNYQKRNVDTVSILLNKALALASALKNRSYLNRLLRQKGEQYHDHGKYPEAVKTYHESARYRMLNNAGEDTYLLTLFSTSFLDMNNKDSAGWYAYAAVDSAKKYQLKKELADAYRVLYQYYYHFGEYRKAIDAILLLDSLDDQTTNAETGQTIMRAQMKYDQEKKDLLASIEQSNKEAAARKKKTLHMALSELSFC